MHKLLASTLGALSLLSSSTYALQINPTIGSDITADKTITKILLDYTLINAKMPSSSSIGFKTDLPLHIIPMFFKLFNEDKASFIPTDGLDGTHSTITFGYVVEDNSGIKSIFPASCNLIRLNMVTNVVITKDGCKVS
jgi:hypothetical protein